MVEKNYTHAKKTDYIIKCAVIRMNKKTWYLCRKHAAKSLNY